MTIDTLSTIGLKDTPSTLAGLDTTRLKAMRNRALSACFKRMEDIPGRMEFVASIRGREYYNDAASRNVMATWYTLESLQGGLIWITCGTTEKVDYSYLQPIVLRKVRLILVLGNADNIIKTFEPMGTKILKCSDMADAMDKAYHYVSEDVRVVFSPATSSVATSESLGDYFRLEVNEL